MSDLIFEKYALLHRIAHGGDGDIFVARQTVGIDRHVVLKSYRSDPDDDPEAANEFFEAARIAALVNHPNVVSIYDVGEWKGTFWIVMEHIDGKDLTGLWYGAASAGTGIPFHVTAQIIHDAAVGLHYAHEAHDVDRAPLQLVHRDLSPPNIMVRRDGVTKIVDFGIARTQRRPGRRTKNPKRKLQYLSPEQVRGDDLDGRSDQFSLGTILWEMCTGKRLFKAASEAATLQKVLRAEVPPPSEFVANFPGRLEDIILKMLRKEPSERYASCLEVATEVGVFLETTPRKKRVTVADFMTEIFGDDTTMQTDTMHLEAAPGNTANQKAGDAAGVDTTESDSMTKSKKPKRPKQSERQLDLGLDAQGEPEEFAINVQTEQGAEYVYASIDEVRAEVNAKKLGPHDLISIQQNPKISLQGHHAFADLFPDRVEQDAPSTALVVHAPNKEGADARDEDDLSAMFERRDAPDGEDADDDVAPDMPNHIDLKASLDNETRFGNDDEQEQTAPPHQASEPASPPASNFEDIDDFEFGSPNKKLWKAAGLVGVLVLFAVFAFTCIGGSSESEPEVKQAGGFESTELLGLLKSNEATALLNAARNSVGRHTTPVLIHASLLASAQARNTLEMARLAKSRNDEQSFQTKADILEKNAMEAAEGVITSKPESPWGHIAKAHVLSLGDDQKSFDASLKKAVEHAGEALPSIEHEKKYLEAYRAMFEKDASGDRSVHHAALSKMAASGDHRSAYLLAVMQAASGNSQAAQKSLAMIPDGESDADKPALKTILLESIKGESAKPSSPDAAATDTNNATDKSSPKPEAEAKGNTAAATSGTQRKVSRTQQLLVQAKEDLRKNSNNAARKKCDDVLRSEPENFEALLCSGQSTLALRQTAGAIRAFRKAVKLQPRSARAGLGLASALQFANRLEDAEKEYDRVSGLRMTPSQKKRAEKALKSLRK